MAETVIMPKLGFDMAEGTLVRWVKKPGEAVNKGDVLAEIETDKATVEVESPYPGIVARQLVEAGAVVPVGDPIAVIASEGEKVDESQPPAKAGPPAEQKADEPQPVPEPGQSKESSQPDGPANTSGQAPAAAVDTSAAAARNEGQVPAGKQPESPAQPPAPRTAPPEPGAQDGGAGAGEAEEGRIKASPLARKLARERGLDLNQVTGTGPNGRITRRDLEAQPHQAPAGPARQPAAFPTVAVPAVGGPLPADSQVPLSRLRQAIGRRMVESSRTVPVFYVTRDFVVDNLVELRRQLNLALSEADKLSYNDFIVKAVALTLRQFPNLNASLQGESLLQHGHINVSVAVAVEGGLLTVVCRDADQKSLRQLSSDLKSMIARAVSGKIKAEDVEGSTFSTSNLGMYGVDEFTAIINPPEAAILAVGGVRKAWAEIEGTVRPSSRMKATLSADHRITDGAEAARFMQALAVFLENPALML